MYNKKYPSLSISVGSSIAVAYASRLDGRFEIINPVNDNKYFYSVVSFNKKSDKYMFYRNNNYSVVDNIMKFIGKKYDEVNQNELKDKCYKIIRNEDGYCEYEVLHNNEIKHYNPTYILSLLFKHIKIVSLPQRRYKYELDYAVILTIPVEFNNLQRKEIIKSAKDAGLIVEKLIIEPIAAAFGYLDNRSITKPNCNILICDFGENSFESSIFNMENKKMKIISNSKDDHLGGKYITMRLEEYIKKDMKDLYGIDVSKNEKLKSKIHKECEYAKISLSYECNFTVRVGLGDEIKISESLLYYYLCKDLFEKTIITINKSIDYGKVKNIDYIILIGGSSRIPKFQEIIKKHFPSIPILNNKNPQEIISEGACRYLYSQKEKANKYEMIDILLRSLNIGIKQNKNMKLTYGIDLGSTYSSSAFVGFDENINIIPDVGNNSIPSCILYSENSSNKLIGFSALQKSISQNRKNLLYDSKRFIGKKYNEIPHKDIESYPFELVERNNFPYYKVVYNNEEKYISPIEISSEILKYIHHYSIPRITHEVENINENEIEVVIGVPAAFTKSQRESTIESCKMAGLKNIDLLSEPTAAALSYIFNNEIKKNECKILVYDFGGGTFDVSIIELKNKVVTILGTFGEEHLGGEDITMRIEEYVKEDIKNKFGIEINDNPKLKSRIHKYCEEAKISLSDSKEFFFDIDLGDENEYEESITKDKFNDLCIDLFLKTIETANYALNRCYIKDNELDYIVLVGGTSRIPKIEEMLKSEFKESKICKSVNTNEDIAKGCAIHSKCLIDENFYKYKIIDNSSICSEDGKRNAIEGYKIETIINRQSELPAKYKKSIKLGKDENILNIYEDKLNSSDQMLIGQVEIGNHKNEEIEVEFEANNDGLLKVKIKVDERLIEENIEYF